VQSLFDYSRIVAPFTGVVTKRYADTGSMIQAGTSSQTQAMPLVRLAQNDLLRLVIPVPESVVPSIRLGSPIEVQVPALRKNFTGSVARFADKVDMSTRTMHTELDVPNPALDLVPGMYATVSIPLGQKRQALAVPVQAIDRGQDTATVYFVSAEGRLKSRAVDLGIETPDQVEILSGLNENDLVVVGNRSQLRPGMAVRPDVVTAAAASGGT
jgi:RND family efflux transporter MFP subunit